MTPLPDANDIRLVKGFFDGGEPLNLHLHSPAVSLGNGVEIILKSVQSVLLRPSCNGCNDISFHSSRFAALRCS